MKVRTIIITAGAILALTVTATAGARSVSENSFQVKKQTGTFHKATHTKTGQKGTTGKSATVSKRPTYPVTYIYIPGPLTPSPLWVDTCENSGNNCTPQEACDIWGFNCDQLAADPQQLVATSEQNGAAAQ